MFHEMNIAGISHRLPLCRINDDLYIGAFVLFGNAALTEASARELLKKAPEYDYILTAEAKGIPLAHEMSRQSSKPYIVARKYPKLYMTGVFEADVRSISTDKEQKLYLDTAEAEMMRGKKILIVDDVISTGASLTALEKLIGCAEGLLAGKMTVLAEGDAQERTDIIYLEKLPLFNADGTIKE